MLGGGPEFEHGRCVGNLWKSEILLLMVSV